MSELVKRIRSFRVDNDLSLFDMAKSIGFSSAKLSQFECGNVEIDVADIDKILSFISAPQSEWVSVDSYEEIPIGTWQVAELRKVGSPAIHIAEIGANLSIIGGHFGFDRGRIYAYAPCLELPIPPKAKANDKTN